MYILQNESYLVYTRKDVSENSEGVTSTSFQTRSRVEIDQIQWSG
ncbi:hypothetical protein [Paenibacillus tundrae]